MSFISPKARLDGHLEGENVILGGTVIGEGSLIGKGVIVGYPVRKSIRSLLPSSAFNMKQYDSISKGAEIGNNCIIRSGTVVYEGVIIGDGVETGHNVLIREGSVIGGGSRIGSSTQLDGTIKIGKNVNIQSNVYLPHLTVVGDGAFIAPNVCFTNDLYPRSRRLLGVKVEKNAVICANACIIAGVVVGENSVVGAGAVVTKDVFENTVVMGAPARNYITQKEYLKKKKLWEEKI